MRDSAYNDIMKSKGILKGNKMNKKMENAYNFGKNIGLSVGEDVKPASLLVCIQYQEGAALSCGDENQAAYHQGHVDGLKELFKKSA